MVIFDKLKAHLPPILRGVQTLIAWLRVLAAPLQVLSQLYDLYLVFKRYELTFNGQVIYLEHRLNDEFDDDLRRIYIDDPQPTNIQPRIVTNRAENQPTLTFYNRADNQTTIILYRQAELQTRFSFVVFVPTSILNNYQNAIKSVVNFYRIAGVNWTFQAI
jgi:hypothetical protein